MTRVWSSAFASSVPLLPAADIPQERKARVLVVEDDPDNAVTLALLLRAWGFDVEVALTGPEALERAGAYRPDVALVDLGLPGLSGYEVARRLRRQEGLGKVALVAVTGFGDEAHRRRADEAGFLFYLVKPADPGSLQAVLTGLAQLRAPVGGAAGSG